MNKKAQRGVFGFSLLVVAFVLILVLLSIVEPFKESLDDTRNTDELNCPGTVNFNSTAYSEDTEFQKLVRRPTCFITGISMVYFVIAFVIALFSWVGVNWRKVSK